MKLADGYDRRKHPTVYEYRLMTNTEARQLSGEFEFESLDGKARRARVTGAVKTWKTRPEEFRLPIKYGMYESSAIVNGPDGNAIIEGSRRPVLVRLETC